MASARIVQMAVDAARTAIAPVIEQVARFGPIPDGFWRDPYVLGYLSSIGGLVGETETDGRLGTKELARASFRALGALAGRHPRELREAVEGGNDDARAAFEEGFFAAVKVAAVYDGIDDALAQDEDVREAMALVANYKAELDERGAPDVEAERVMKVLELKLFTGYVIAIFFPHLVPSSSPAAEGPASGPVQPAE